jgi:hypothetical protein
MKTMTVGLENIRDPNTQQSIIKIVKQHAHEDLYVFGISLWENINPKSFWPSVLEVANECKRLGANFAAILNSSTLRFRPIDFEVPVLHIDFFLIRTVHFLEMQNEFPTHGPELSFLVGKANKPHRAPLLKRFQQNNQLDTLKWSLKTELPEYQDLVRSLDSVTIINNTHYAAFPIDMSILDSTCASLVSETAWIPYDPPWITEKTWKPIYLKQPFVIASSPGTLAVIESMGFDTYTDLLPYPNYDSESDSEKRLDQVYKNAVALREYASTHDLSKRTLANHQRVVELYHINLQRIKEFVKYFNPLDVVPMADQITESEEYSRFFTPH